MEPGAVNNAPGDGNFKMPTLEELLEALQNMEGIPEEEKEKLRDNLIARANEAKPGFMPPMNGPTFGTAPDLAILFGLITVVGLIFESKFGCCLLSGNKVWPKMANLNEIKKNNLDVDELSEKIKNVANALKEEFGDDFKDKLGQLLQTRVNYYAHAFIFCVVLLVVIFAFFGYKLYKSLTAREKRKEEKRRQKQQKKKK
ncbi:uncharacterized protein LOC103313530 [Tribolium castaneum]|uniref:uncharacterized protein LOC103313530 n=1 Tax=Tribolium castaneum TaxID=7070 RepID=UPI0030FF34AE